MGAVHPRHSPYERIVLTIAVLGLFVAGYFGVGLGVDPARAHDLATPLDRAIPFVPHAIWIYLWMFPAALMPVFLVGCPLLFRRTCLAYASVIVLSLAVFFAYPVTSTGLRVDRAALDTTRFATWAVATLYGLDPPYNLFPSLHLSVAVLAAIAVAKADRRWGVPALASVGLVAISICTVKQHFVADGVAGLVLGAAAGRVFLAPYRPPEGTTPAAGRRALVAYVLLLVVVYSGLYVWFRGSV